MNTININNLENALDKLKQDEDLNTLEPSIIAANTINGKISDDFINGISKNGSMKGKTKEEIKNFMEHNKTEWSMRILTIIKI